MTNTSAILGQYETEGHEGFEISEVGCCKSASRIERTGSNHRIHAKASRPADCIEELGGGRGLCLFESDDPA